MPQRNKKKSKAPSRPGSPGAPANALVLASPEINISAAESGEAEGQQPKVRRFKMTAYTGGAMHVGYRHPVVVDLPGLDVGASARPILIDHINALEYVLGQTEKVEVKGNALVAEGSIFGESEMARQAIALNDRGFKFQASVGLSVSNMEFVEAGSTAQANGREFRGPVYVARRSRLAEISFVTLGADDRTSASIAARAAEQGEVMDFEQWLRASGFDPDTLTDGQKATLQAAFDAQQDEPDDGESAPAPVTAAGGAATVTAADPALTATVERIEKQLREATIRATFGGKYPKLQEQALTAGWDEDRCRQAIELEDLRASRPQLQIVASGAAKDRPATAQVVEAALCASGGISEDVVGKTYGERVANEAVSASYRGAGLQTLIRMQLAAAGESGGFGRIDNDTIRAAFAADQQLRASGFTSFSLSGILGNVANKRLLASFEAVPAVSERICAVEPMNDFKVHSRYRMTAGGRMQKVGPDGELKHAQLSEEEFTNQLDTYGQIITLTRQQIINDDLGAFLMLPKALGRNSALARERAVFELILANTGNFFHADNSNFITGADTSLSIDALSAAKTKFHQQKDDNGEPIVLSPSVLLVPPELEDSADRIYTGEFVNETTSTGKPVANHNPHRNRFQPVMSPYLSNTALTGSSATAWYLFADASDIAAFVLGYLNGRNVPTIERGSVDFDKLGISYRGYFDFGVGQGDPKAAVKSKGAA